MNFAEKIASYIECARDANHAAIDYRRLRLYKLASAALSCRDDAMRMARMAKGANNASV